MLMLDALMKRTRDALDEERRLTDGYNEDKREAAKDKDFRENSAYQKAVEDIEQSAARQVRLQNTLIALEQMVELKYTSTGFADIGSTVTIFREDTQKKFTFELVPDELGDATENLVAVTSLLGQAVAGRQAGENILVNTGTHSYTALITEVI